MKNFILNLLLGLFVLATWPVQQSQASAYENPVKTEQVSTYDVDFVSFDVDYLEGYEMSYQIYPVTEGWMFIVDENKSQSQVYRSLDEATEMALYDDSEQGLSIDQVTLKAKLRKKTNLFQRNRWVLKDAPRCYQAGLFAGLISSDGDTTTVGVDDPTVDDPISFFDWIIQNQALLLGLLLAISEILALIPGINQNGIFQTIFSWLKSKKPTT